MESDQSAARTRSHGVVFVFFLAQSTTRWAQGCRPRSKQQVGFEKEDQDLVSALATAKNASCCRCAKHRADIRDPDRPLPNSRPLARSLCGHATRSRLADGEAGKIPCVEFYGARICGTSRSDRQMRCYPISARINHVANDDEECSRAVGLAGIRISYSPKQDFYAVERRFQIVSCFGSRTRRREEHGSFHPRIRCPLCGWSPRKEDRWFCDCGHEWNTFDTGGVCPACLHQWASTQCLSCARWSPHSEWYVQ